MSAIPGRKVGRTQAGGRAGRPPSRNRRRRGGDKGGAWKLYALLLGLTLVNVYVFYFKRDTAVSGLFQEAAILGRQPAGAGQTDPALPIAPDDEGEAAPVAERPALDGTTAVEADRAGRVREGEIGKLDTLSTLLAREGFEQVALRVSAALAPLVDPRSIRPGARYTLTFDAEGTPAAFEYRPTALDAYLVTRDEQGNWKARHEQRALDVRVEQVAGAIRSSLYGAVQAAGESPALVSMLVDLFAWDINFYTDTHPGDHFKVVVEKQYLDGAFYRYGKLLAAEYGGKVGRFRAFYFQDGGKDQYFDEKGQSIAKSFLKTPLRFVRISSKFDHKRFHPVLHRTKAHLGVDYAAPRGTPVWAAASGKVVEAGYQRGSGNTVVIKHTSGYATRYYHLDKFAKGLQAGQNVTQKQVIGYVGSTGLSTGPHLHFGVTLNGAFVDPLQLKPWRETPVSRKGAYLAAIAPHVLALDGMKAEMARLEPSE